MKKFLLPLLALALTATAASAQDTQTDQMGGMQGGQGQRQRRSPEEMATMQTKRLTQELSLTPDQATKVQQIMLARTNDMQAMRGQGQGQGGDRSQMREQMQTMRAKYEEQFKGVLTADQFTKFTAMEQQRGGGRGGMGGGRMGQGGPDGAAPAAQPVDGKVKIKNDKVKVKTTE
ncbi:MAG: hypothetical protein ACRYFX_17260 [Janthinobacterium lividum]